MPNFDLITKCKCIMTIVLDSACRLEYLYTLLVINAFDITVLTLMMNKMQVT